MAFDTVIDKAQLEGAITASANAIRGKTGGTDPIQWLSDKGFSEAIAAIETGVQLPTLENPGTASDLVKGLELIGENGSVITGTMPITSSYNVGLPSTGELSYDESNNRIVITGKHDALNGRWCLERDATITKKIDAPRFGNAKREDVVKGKFFTSEAGLMVEGTHVCTDVGTPETWTLTLEDGSTVEKVVYVK